MIINVCVSVSHDFRMWRVLYCLNYRSIIQDVFYFYFLQQRYCGAICEDVMIMQIFQWCNKAEIYGHQWFLFVFYPLSSKTQANLLGHLRWISKTLQCTWSGGQWTQVSHFWHPMLVHWKMSKGNEKSFWPHVSA